MPRRELDAYFEHQEEPSFTEYERYLDSVRGDCSESIVSTLPTSLYTFYRSVYFSNGDVDSFSEKPLEDILEECMNSVPVFRRCIVKENDTFQCLPYTKDLLDTTCFYDILLDQAYEENTIRYFQGVSTLFIKREPGARTILEGLSIPLQTSVEDETPEYGIFFLDAILTKTNAYTVNNTQWINETTRETYTSFHDMRIKEQGIEESVLLLVYTISN
jgi:hypothetical protein